MITKDELKGLLQADDICARFHSRLNLYLAERTVKNLPVFPDLGFIGEMRMASSPTWAESYRILTAKAIDALEKFVAAYQRDWYRQNDTANATTVWNCHYLGNQDFDALRNRASVLLRDITATAVSTTLWTATRDYVAQELLAHVKNTASIMEKYKREVSRADRLGDELAGARAANKKFEQDHRFLSQTNDDLAQEIDKVRQGLKLEVSQVIKLRQVAEVAEANERMALRNLEATKEKMEKQSGHLAAALKEKNDALQETARYKHVLNTYGYDLKLKAKMPKGPGLRRTDQGYDVGKKPMEVADCIKLICHYCATGVPVNRMHPSDRNWIHSNGSFCKAYVVYNALAEQRQALLANPTCPCGSTQHTAENHLLEQR